MSVVDRNNNYGQFTSQSVVESEQCLDTQAAITKDVQGKSVVITTWQLWQVVPYSALSGAMADHC